MALVDPATLSGCTLVIDPETLNGSLNDGDPVSSIVDSIQSIAFTAPGDPNRPTFLKGASGLNGKSVLSYDGNDALLNSAVNIADFLNDTEVTVICVLYPSSADSYNSFLNIPNPNAANHVYIGDYGGKLYFHYGWEGNGYVSWVEAGWSNIWHISYFDRDTSHLQRIVIDDSVKVSATVGDATGFATTGTPAVNIGGLSGYFTGKLAYLAIVNRKITFAEYTNTNNWLCNRFNLNGGGPAQLSRSETWVIP